MKITSSIWEWRIVATALIILSTLGFEMVDPMYIEFIVEDFLTSSSSSFECIFILFNIIIRFLNIANLYFIEFNFILNGFNNYYFMVV